ncbi:RCC1 domain-containing protein [Catellatospora aurea]|uniref:RCC1 domain-containing protein n=1 Tax=Catellatospora aurea TaxID=1337874 RepID=A0ABW2GWB4_9ACTN
MTDRHLTRRRLGAAALGALLTLPAVGSAWAGPEPARHLVEAVVETPYADAWGANGVGQLGDATDDDRVTPIAVAGNAGMKAVAAGFQHSLALLINGTVRGWGQNNRGQVGDGTQDIRFTPGTVVGLSDVKAVAAGSFHSVALRADGTVWTWGDNTRGQLGDGVATGFSSVPVQVLRAAAKPLTGVKAVAAGADHTLALLGDGSVVAWGANGSGQLGNGVTGGISRTPVAVSRLAKVTAVAAGGAHSMALLSDGTVRTWGSNGSGELGNGSNVAESNLPVAVAGLSGVRGIAAGESHDLALVKKGTVKSWGDNNRGQLGLGTNLPQSNLPVDVVDLTGVRQVAAGAFHTLAAG